MYFSARALGVGIGSGTKNALPSQDKRQKRGSCGTTPIAGKSGHSAASAMMDRECAALDNGRPPVPLTQPWAFSEQLRDDLSSGPHCRLAPPGGSLKCWTGILFPFNAIVLIAVLNGSDYRPAPFVCQ